jgi:hypothetical protein
VKSSHHAQFAEAWYPQDSRPLAAQLLYDLGVEADEDPILDSDHTITADRTLHLSQNISLTTPRGRYPSAVNISIFLSGALSNLIRLPLNLLELGLSPLISRLNVFEQ